MTNYLNKLHIHNEYCSYYRMCSVASNVTFCNMDIELGYRIRNLISLFKQASILKKQHQRRCWKVQKLICSQRFSSLSDETLDLADHGTTEELPPFQLVYNYYWALAQLYFMCQLQPFQALLTVVYTLITSQMAYYNSFYVWMSVKTICTLHLVQNQQPKKLGRLLICPCHMTTLRALLVASWLPNAIQRVDKSTWKALWLSARLPGPRDFYSSNREGSPLNPNLKDCYYQGP